MNKSLNLRPLLLVLGLQSLVLSACGQFNASSDRTSQLSVVTCNVSSPCRARLGWKDMSTTETGFQVERTVGLGSDGFSIVGTTGENIEEYEDFDVQIGQTYCYRVRAFNTETASAYSNTACGQVNGAGFLKLSIQ